MTQPRPEPESAVTVTVTRTGGFAGLRREWVANATADDAPRWIALVDACPWEAVAAPEPPTGADLFVWRIRASVDAAATTDERRAELQDPQVQGAWQDLIEAVRASSDAGSSAG